MNIVDNNYNIAVFMGSKYSKDRLLDIDDNQIFVPYHGVCRYDTIELGKGKILEYHKSWDWLMPVVDKIKSLDESEFNYQATNMTLFRKQKKSLLNIPISSEIDVVYSQIVDFIKWYNDAK